MNNKDWKKFFLDLTPDSLDETEELYNNFFEELDKDPTDALKLVLLISGLSNCDRASFMLGALFSLAATKVENEEYIKKLGEEAVKAKLKILEKKIWN